VVSWLLGLALAADGEATDDDDEVVAEEITVYAEQRVRQARQRVVNQLKAMGYDEQVDEVGDRTVYRHSEPWKGEVVLHDDGWTVVRRQPLRVEGRKMPWTKANTPVAWAGCLLYPWFCIRPGGTLVGTAKWRAVEGRTVDFIHPDVREWGDRIADLATQRKVGDLPERLEALWSEGVPLEGGEPLATMEERRWALMSFWASRTDTAWGDEVRAAVGAFCRAVVQSSDHPFTDAEIEAHRRAHPDLRPFTLERAGVGAFDP
jgi:hypothetical protein